MAAAKLRETAETFARRQHGVVSRRQLLGAGVGERAIRHGLASGRLHRLLPGVYVVGRRSIGQRGRWMGAVLACGPGALVSHRSAAALWGMVKVDRPPIAVVVPAEARRRAPGVRAHRRLETPERLERARVRALIEEPADWRPSAKALLLVTEVDRIPVTGPAVTLVDFASCSPLGELEAAINEADHLRLIDPETLRAVLDLLPGRPGLVKLRQLLDVAVHTLTTTQLERQFLPLVERSGLPQPTTQRYLGRHRVDFYWADLGLVVETDSLRYHRTALKQSADKRRDNRHARSGLVTLRFTHRDISFAQAYVLGELRGVARSLQRNGGRSLTL